VGGFGVPIRNKWMPFTKLVIQDLPMRESGVYEVGKEQDDIVLYIGHSSSSMRSRLLIHKEKVDFLKCTHFRKRKTDPNDSSKIEKQLIKQYLRQYGIKPPINKIMSPGDPWEGILY